VEPAVVGKRVVAAENAEIAIHEPSQLDAADLARGLDQTEPPRWPARRISGGHRENPALIEIDADAPLGRRMLTGRIRDGFAGEDAARRRHRHRDRPGAQRHDHDQQRRAPPTPTWPYCGGLVRDTIELAIRFVERR
jgi:hypothetical protein